MTVSNNLILDIDQENDTSSFLSGITDRKSIATNTTSIFYVSFVSPFSESAKQILNKINDFRALKENWDSYGATPPSDAVIDEAVSFVRKADKNLLPFYFAAPGPNGELVIEFKKGNKEAAAYFNPDGGSELVLSDNNQILFEGFLEENYKDLLLFING